MSRRPIVVKESEKCASLMMTNLKQKVILKQNMQVLDKACDRVCSHITLGQRLTYKRFKQKLARAKMTYAKIKCDKEMERDLRKKNMGFTYNTNYGQDPEDEEVLQKIWNSSNPKLKVRAQTAPAGPPRAASTVTIAQPTVLQRPDTVAHGVLPEITENGKAKFISTGLRATQFDDDDDEGDDFFDESEGEDGGQDVKRKSKSAKVSKDGVSFQQQRKALKSAPAKGSQSQRNAPNIFEEDTRPSLLDIQKERVKSANYESKVKELCDSMKPFKVDSSKVIPDYYLVVLQSRSKEVQRMSTYQRRVSEVTEQDIKRATGTPALPSMTMKRLNWDFENRQQEQSPRVMNPTRRMSISAW